MDYFKYLYIIVFIALIIFCIVIVSVANQGNISANDKDIKFCKEHKGKLIYVGYSDSYNCLLP